MVTCMSIAIRRTLNGCASSKSYMRPYLGRSHSMIFGAASSTTCCRAAVHSGMFPILYGSTPSPKGFLAFHDLLAVHVEPEVIVELGQQPGLGFEVQPGGQVVGQREVRHFCRPGHVLVDDDVAVNGDASYRFRQTQRSARRAAAGRPRRRASGLFSIGQ